MSQTLAPLPETQPSDEGILSSHRVKLLIAFTVLVGALGYIIFQAFSGATIYYYTVGEINDIGPSSRGQDSPRQRQVGAGIVPPRRRLYALRVPPDRWRRDPRRSPRRRAPRPVLQRTLRDHPRRQLRPQRHIQERKHHREVPVEVRRRRGRHRLRLSVSSKQRL